MAVPFGNYMLERWLAQGGMANIFISTYAGPLGFEREMVLKVILPEYAHHSGFISMFLDEARLAARLNHPNIVQVTDLGQEGDYFYIAMEYVNGPSLSRALTRARKEGRGMSPGMAVFVVGEVLEALTYAHRRRDRSGRPLGVVHRDVNPQNVLLSFDGHVKLADFGVAKANVNIHNSKAGVIKGKYSHMAPEQCLTARSVDRRADLFAAGIVLHELLTGRPLFSRPTAYEMMKAVVDEPVPPPSRVNPRAPGELDGLVLKALAKDPSKRFQSGMAMLDALHLVARRLRILEGKHELRAFLSRVYGKGRNNLAGDQEPGIPVTEDRISEILKGFNNSSEEPDKYDRDLALEPGQRSLPSLVSETGSDWTPEPELEWERTNGWGELELESADADADAWATPREREGSG